MRAAKSILLLAALLAMPTVTPATAAEGPTTIEGEVVQVTQSVRTANEGELDALTIRTRKGEEMQLLLGKAGTSAEQFQSGDRIRARLTGDGPTADGYRVRNMKVRRTGQSIAYRDADGAMLQSQTQTRSRNHDGTGSGDQARTRSQSRIHEPGTGGGCPNGGGGSRGGGSRGGGGRHGS